MTDDISIKSPTYSDSSDPLQSAIKQVAKEMAEAMRCLQLETKKPKESSNSIKNNSLDKNSSESNQSDKTDPKGERLVITNRDIKMISTNKRYFDIEERQKKSHYEKEIETYNKLQHRLELQRNKKFQEEMRLNTGKPTLTANTKRIIKSKLAKDKPIYIRTEEVIKQRNVKLEMLKSVYKELDEMEELEHRSRFNTHKIGNKESIDNFICDQMLWLKNKEDKLQFIRSEIDWKHRNLFIIRTSPK
jgi:hypothetical protein